MQVSRAHLHAGTCSRLDREGGDGRDSSEDAGEEGGETHSEWAYEGRVGIRRERCKGEMMERFRCLRLD